MKSEKRSPPTNIFGSISAKLFEICYQVDVSEQFIQCAGEQLAIHFEEITGIKIAGTGIELFWHPDKEAFVYTKGPVSTITTAIRFTYGIAPATICWKSRSGRIYGIADTDIDCKDIDFWLVNLDIDQCKAFYKPKWTLFTFPKSSADTFRAGNPGNDISIEFIRCADAQLTPMFETVVGFRINKEVSINLTMENEFKYTKDKISRLAIVFYVNHNWNRNVSMLWKSKSGRIYDMADTDIDCNDIEFWIEGIDPLLYNKQMFPKAALPFKLKNLSFELVITRLNLDMTIVMEFKLGITADKETIAHQVDLFIDDYNTHAGKNGVVHNWKRRIEGQQVVYELDMGSAGPLFLKKLLQYLSKTGHFMRVEIGG